MNVDAKDFPVVRLFQPQGDAMPMGEVLAVFSALLTRDEPFVFYSEGGFDGDGPNGDVADRRDMSLWVKANKAEIRRLIRAHVHLETEAAARVAAEAFAPNSQKFWGYPMLIAATADEARAMCDTMLAERADAAASH